MSGRPPASLAAELQRLGRGFQWLAVFCLAWLWRRLLVRTTFVALTGSVGKTTAKELLAAAMATHAPTAHSFGNQNDEWGVPRSILRVRPWHRFAVLEVGAGLPGAMGRSARLLKPHFAAVLSVAPVHTDRFPTLDDVASEKATLLHALDSSATAILHADDPYVAAMADGAAYAVRTFGTGPDCDVRADGVAGRWPERLRLDIHEDGLRWEVRTRLVGTHWVPSVLAAWSLARACGVPAEGLVEALAHREPATGRLEPVALASGATILRDEGGATIPSLKRALAVIGDARAERRWVVMSDVSGCRQGTRKRLRRLARGIAELAEGAVFIGPHGHHGVSAAVAAGMSPDLARHFERFEEAAVFLAQALGPGDLALLKGRATDHLSRIVLAQRGEVACGLRYCQKRSLCDFCPELWAPGGGP